MRWRRKKQRAYDIVTPTEQKRRNTEIDKRRRRYFAIMLPCLALVSFGFFVPAPTPVRVVALVIAAVLPPIAAIAANE